MKTPIENKSLPLISKDPSKVENLYENKPNLKVKDNLAFAKAAEHHQYVLRAPLLEK